MYFEWVFSVQNLDVTARITPDSQVHFYYDLLNHNKSDQETSALGRNSQKKNFENDFLKIEDWQLVPDLFLKTKNLDLLKVWQRWMDDGWMEVWQRWMDDTCFEDLYWGMTDKFGL